MTMMSAMSETDMTTSVTFGGGRERSTDIGAALACRDM
jgi:hypothetical protein